MGVSGMEGADIAAGIDSHGTVVAEPLLLALGIKMPFSTICVPSSTVKYLSSAIFQKVDLWGRFSSTRTKESLLAKVNLIEDLNFGAFPGTL
ncbi:hypothetical protein FKM82_012014 [Ascaphus truei]